MRASVQFTMPYSHDSVAWSPDGRTLLVVGGGSQACVLDTRDGSVLRSMTKTGNGWQGRYSPDGRLFAIASIGIQLYEADSDAAPHFIECSANEMALAFSDDGRWLATGSGSRANAGGFAAGTVHLWDLASRTRVHGLAGLTGDPRLLFFLPGGKRLCAFSFGRGTGGEAIVWNVHDGALIRRHTFDGSGWSAEGAGPSSPDATHVLHKTDAKTDAALWNSATGQVRTVYEGELPIRGLAMTADLRLLAVGLGDDQVLLFDVALGKTAARIEQTPCQRLWFSPDGRRLLCTGSRSNDGAGSEGNEALIWEVGDLAADMATPALHGSWLTRQLASMQRLARGSSSATEEYWVPHLPSGDGAEVLGVIVGDRGNGDAAVQIGDRGRRLYMSYGGVDSAWDLTSGEPLWTEAEPADLSAQDVDFSCDLELSEAEGLLLISKRGTHAMVRRARDGAEVVRIARNRHPWRHFTGTPLAIGARGDVIALAEGDPTAIRLVSTDGRSELDRIDIASWAHAIALSADGRLLAIGTEQGGLEIRDLHRRTVLHDLVAPRERLWSVAFSADGSMLAEAGIGHVIRLWDCSTGAEIRQVAGHQGNVYHAQFSPDGARLASGSDDKTVRVWDVATGSELQRFEFPEVECWRVAWAPSGAFLAAGFRDGVVRLYDTRTARMTAAALRQPDHTAPAVDAAPTPIPAAWRRLPDLWLALHRLGIAAPLSLLQDLRLLLGGQPVASLQDLQSHPGLQALRALRWPDEARCSLLALLLHGWPGAAAWRPDVQPDKPGSTPGDRHGGIPADGRLLRDALAQGLSGPVCDTAAPPAPLAWLAQSLARVDDRLLTLLAALGPQAAAADPGLPLRLLPQVGRLPALGALQRQLLGLRLSPPEAGPAQGSGAGLDRSGFANQGVVTALVPSQWAYPAELLRWRQHNGGLLYRTRTGREPPQLRPLVIVLDTSPACWGPIEAVTRPAAHALAEALARQQRPALLLTAGDLQVHPLTQPAERLQVLTHRSLAPVDPVAVLTRAQALARQLPQGPLAPVVLLLTHCWWGADLERPAAVPGLRALFVQYPGARVRPAFAAHCELWESPAHHQAAGLAAALGRLTG